jgi:hypothetical protein
MPAYLSIMSKKMILIKEHKQLIMRLGIMQPYFFPNLGYFSLIHATNYWVFFDNVQFIRHGWIERNRVIDSNQGISYIKVPLNKFKREEKIKNVSINQSIQWEKKILDQLTSYKKAPYYNETINLIYSVLKLKQNSISKLNINIINSICEYLGIEFKYDVYSKMNLNIENKIKLPGDWALEISKHLGADFYINSIGGIELFSFEKFTGNNIKLLFCKNNLSSYKQKKNEFYGGLSIIDVLMFNSKEQAANLIKDYTLKNE